MLIIVEHLEDENEAMQRKLSEGAREEEYRDEMVIRKVASPARGINSSRKSRMSLNALYPRLSTLSGNHHNLSDTFLSVDPNEKPANTPAP